MPKVPRAGMVIDQEYQVVPVDSIQPHPDNPNHGDVDLIGESIEHNDWYGAVIVQKSTRRILAGEHRWRAAKARGASKIPILLRDVDDAKALRILLVDNESARRGEIDHDQVDLILQTLADIGQDELAGSGYDLRVLEGGADDEGEVPEEPAADEGLLDPGDSGIDQTWGVIVVVPSEEEQEELYNQMVEEFGSARVRVVSV
jgi:ParB-like chromosome segregation protein Spo0J